jgi:pantoate--beta-alanine ligase
MALSAARKRFKLGTRDAESLKNTMMDVVSEAPSARIDYVSVADPETLEELDTVRKNALLSLAVQFGAVRLIDNIFLDG